MTSFKATIYGYLLTEYLLRPNATSNPLRIFSNPRHLIAKAAYPFYRGKLWCRAVRWLHRARNLWFQDSKPDPCPDSGLYPSRLTVPSTLWALHAHLSGQWMNGHWISSLLTILYCLTYFKYHNLLSWALDPVFILPNTDLGHLFTKVHLRRGSVLDLF